MAVSTLPALLKSQPAVEKINTFNGCMVTVTRHMTQRSVNGQSVVPTQPMTIKAALELQSSLPLQYGPGYYHFSVVDQGGTGSDEWMIKLGPDQPEGFPMATPNLPGGPGQQQPPLGEGVENLGNGFAYNEARGLLTTPWKRIVAWKPGEPFPEPPPSIPNQPHLSLVPPNATPWGQPQQQWGTGWSNIPVGDSEELKAIKAQNEELKREREREEQRRREDERERRAEERENARAAEFKAILAALTAKPAVDPAVEELKRQNEEIKRQAAETQRRLEESQREDRLRAEMTAQAQRFDVALRELSANKSDPMLTMLMQVMTQSNAAATESMRAIQAAQADANSANERNTQQLVAQLQSTIVNPMQMMQIMTQAKGDGAEAGRMLVEGVKETMALQKSVYEQMLDVASSGGQPAWVSVVQGALDKVGAIGQAIAEKQQAQPEYTPPPAPLRRQVPVQQQRVMQQPPVAGTLPRTAAPPPATVNPALNKTADRPEGTKYDAKTEEFVLADGRRVKQRDVEMHGWGRVLNDPDMNGVGRQPAPTVVAPETAAALDASLNGASEHAMPPPTPISAGKRKPTSRRKKAAQPAPAAPEGYSIEQLREMDEDEIRAATVQFDDEAFFGVLAQFVPNMRSANNGQPPAAEVAKYVKQAEEFVKRSGKPMPPAIELLYAEHIEVLVERIFPGADEAYIDEVGKAIAEIFGIGADDEGEEAEAE